MESRLQPRGAVLGLGAGLIALACGGQADAPDRQQDAPDRSQEVESPQAEIGCHRLAPGASETLAEWGGPDGSVYIADVAAGSACDQYVTGTTWGLLELGGQTLEAGTTFIAHREASGAIGWLKSWQAGDLDWSELAVAPGGGVWARGSAGGSTPDLGDGVSHPVGERGHLLVHYAADGALVTLRVDAGLAGITFASNVAARRSAQVVYDNAGSRLELLDDTAATVWTLPLSDYWGNLDAAPGADGGVVTVGVERPDVTSVIEHHDGAGGTLWREVAERSLVRSLSVLPEGEVVLSGSFCQRLVTVSSECDAGGSFLRLIEPSGDTRFEVAHDLGPRALVAANADGQILLIGEDSLNQRLALQRVDRDGHLGERHLFDGPATLDPLRASVSGKSVWVAGTRRGELVDDVATNDRGFLLEMGL